MTDIPAIEVEELRDLLKSPDPPLIIDVREKWEADICSLPYARLIPLGSLPAHLAELPKDRKIVVHCHHGGRSARAVNYLIQQGYKDIFNLIGGIHNWSQRIDPNVKIYG